MTRNSLLLLFYYANGKNLRMYFFNVDQTQDMDRIEASDYPIKEVFIAIWYGRFQPF